MQKVAHLKQGLIKKVLQSRLINILTILLLHQPNLLTLPAFRSRVLQALR